MANIKPFAALRPRPELAARVCELPYDVMSSEEARQIAAGNPLSFLHVSKPEIDLPPRTDLYSPEVYAQGKRNYEKLIGQGALQQDLKPCFYLYRQVMDKHEQIGFVAVASCEDYLRGIIKKHELTRVDKENDRVRHIETLNSQTGPVFLVYPATEELDRFIVKHTSELPVIDFTAPDGVRHTSWNVSADKDIAFVQTAFVGMPFLYIADGHHRSAAAARVCQARQGGGESGWFLSVIFPHNRMQILPYNRVLKDLNGHALTTLLERLHAVFEMEPGGSPTPSRKHQLGFYLKEGWRTLNFRRELTGGGNPIETLDVSLLQKHVLQPVFGVDDPRTSNRVSFVGGIRGTAELEKLVDSGEYACAFSMFPTSIEDLMKIADANGIMPPKSTWFEPKLRDAMFCHGI